MGRSTTSLRLDDGLRERLTLMAQAEGISLNALVERMLREGIAVVEHPGIMFNPGPSGRRATVIGGPDVWEVMSAWRYTSGTEAERVAALVEEFGIQERQISIAVNYAMHHPEEIETRIRANDNAFEEAERLAAVRKRLLA